MVTCSDFLKSRETDLVLTGRPSKGRRSLTREGEALLAAIQAAKPFNKQEPFSDESVESIAKFNRAALLQLYYGDVQRAEALSEKALLVCIGNMNSGGPSGWTWLMINPHHNLARLAAIRGAIDPALEGFRAIYDFFIHKQPLLVHGIALDPIDGREAAQAFGDDFEKAIAASYISGVAKTLLNNGRHDDLLQFLADQQQDTFFQRTPGYEKCLGEIYVRVYTRLQRFQQALDALQQLQSRLSPESPLPPLLAADIYGQMQNQESAQAELTVAESRLDSKSALALPLSYEAARMYFALNKGCAAERNANRALVLATSKGDEPWQMKCLGLLVRITYSRSPQSEVWKSHLQQWYQLSLQSHYRFERALAFAEMATWVQQNEDGEIVQGVTASEFLAHALALLEQIESADAQQWFHELSSMPGDAWAPHARRRENERLSFRNPVCEEIYDTLMAA
jgi:hypothetical protein